MLCYYFVLVSTLQVKLAYQTLFHFWLPRMKRVLLRCLQLLLSISATFSKVLLHSTLNEIPPQAAKDAKSPSPEQTSCSAGPPGSGPWHKGSHPHSAQCHCCRCYLSHSRRWPVQDHLKWKPNFLLLLLGPNWGQKLPFSWTSQSRSLSNSINEKQSPPHPKLDLQVP